MNRYPHPVPFSDFPFVDPPHPEGDAGHALRIVVHMEKVANYVDQATGLRPVLRGQFRAQAPTDFPKSGGWATVDAFRQASKRRENGPVEIEPGVWREDLPTYYGIKSYQIITFPKAT